MGNQEKIPCSEGQLILEDGNGHNFIISSKANAPIDIFDDEIWIEAESGEAMAVHQSKFFECVNEFFKKEF